MSGRAEPAAELRAPTPFGATPEAKRDPFDFRPRIDIFLTAMQISRGP